VQLFEIRAELILKRHTKINAHKLSLSVRRVHGHKVKLREFRADHAPLAVKLFVADAIRHIKRLCFCKDRRAGIPFFLGGVPEFRVPRKIKIRLLALHFRFLQADNIGVFRR